MENDPQSFLYFAGAVALLMLIWDTIEVGRNDAANLVNAVFGARILRRRQAVFVAGLAVIIGATVSSPVMETARKGIFDPTALSQHGPLDQIQSDEVRAQARSEAMHKALSIYISVYMVDTVLLYSFSAFGMPVSTTACLVFELLGGALMLGGVDAVHWPKSRQVILAIICSIIASGIAGFMVQRVFRAAIGRDCRDPKRVQLHGPWIAGAILTGLLFFILLKGMKDVELIQMFRTSTVDAAGPTIALFGIWAALTGVCSTILAWGGRWLQENLFSALAILGMLAIAVAFGQNDLANCASPGLASFMILKEGAFHARVPVPTYLLFICGALLFAGMMTQNAQRVTRAAVNTGSQSDIVRLYAPRWCLWLARRISPEPHPDEALAPREPLIPDGKHQHYDALRAAVITSVSASVIAFASSLGLPVSTTYVSFAAVVATGWSDQIFQRGDAVTKIARTIWVVFCWFFSALLAATVTAVVALVVSNLATFGIVFALVTNITVRTFMKRRADRQEKRLQEEAQQRRQELQRIQESGGAVFESSFEYDD